MLQTLMRVKKAVNGIVKVSMNAGHEFWYVRWLRWDMGEVKRLISQSTKSNQ